MAAPWWDSDWKDRSGPEYRCFVGNLPYGTSESSLKNAFSSYGPLYSEVSDSRSGRRSGRASMVAPLVPSVDLVPVQFLMRPICRVLL
jgi:hypothetical protein